MTPRVIVLGGGVIGLSSAVRLLQAGFPVTVVAREWSPHTTSDVAPAVWYPFRVAPAERVIPWALHAYAVFRELSTKDEAGVSMVEGVQPFAEPVADEAPWHGAVDGYRRAQPAELPAGYVDGWVYRAPVIQMNLYMAWLRSQAAGHGATFDTREVGSLAGVAALFPDGRAPDRSTELSDVAAQVNDTVIVNCTGLGARTLAADSSVVPVRGQIVRVAPGYVSRFVQETTGPNAIAYIIPRPDCTVLGGTADEGNWDITVNDHDAAGILARCARLEPALNSAPVLSHAVGLRPARPQVRLELETTSHGQHVIHNYGHGGAGVTTSWGCARDVVAIATALA